jgi:hypothetical protein
MLPVILGIISQKAARDRISEEQKKVRTEQRKEK